MLIKSIWGNWKIRCFFLKGICILGKLKPSTKVMDRRMCFPRREEASLTSSQQVHNGDSKKGGVVFAANATFNNWCCDIWVIMVVMSQITITQFAWSIQAGPTKNLLLGSSAICYSTPYGREVWLSSLNLGNTVFRLLLRSWSREILEIQL